MQEIEPKQEEIKEVKTRVFGNFENDYDDRERINRLATQFQDKINKRDQLK